MTSTDSDATTSFWIRRLSAVEEPLHGYGNVHIMTRGQGQAQYASGDKLESCSHLHMYDSDIMMWVGTPMMNKEIQ
jgi:hypothetical protein